MPLDKKTVDTLTGVTTATLTTVLLKKGLRNIWLRGTKPLRPGQPRIVGPAFTLRFVPAREDLATPESWASPTSLTRTQDPPTVLRGTSFNCAILSTRLLE